MTDRMDLLSETWEKVSQKTHSFFLHTTYEEEKKSVGAMWKGMKSISGDY